MSHPDADAARGRVEPLAAALVLGLAGLAASTFILSAIGRLAYPWELEWLESEMLHHVARVLEGQPLYAAPSREFAPTIYPPLYAWTGALVAQLTGVNFLAPRLVSVACTLGAALVAGLAAARLSRFAPAGFVAAALLLGAYVPCGTMFDLARLDPLWVLLLLGATAATARAEAAPGRRWPVAAGLLLAAASLTKQPAALFALVLAAALARSCRSRAVLLLAAWAAPTALAYGWLHRSTGGWSSHYLLLLPLKVPHRPAAVLHLLRDDLLGYYGPAIGLIAVWALLPKAARPGEAFPRAWTWGAGAALLATVSMRTLQGGAENTLLPAFAFGAVLAAAIAGRAIVGGIAPARLVVLVTLAIQLARLFWSPTSLIPSAGDRARADRLAALVRSFPGPVWVASHTSYAALSGKPFLVHRDPLLDLLYTGDPHFPADLLESLRRGEFSAVIADAPFAEEAIERALAEGYGPPEPLVDGPAPLVGYRTRPSLLYRPRAAP